MNNFTKYLKVLAVTVLIAISSKTLAQCSANFSYTLGSNGIVNFQSTSTLVGPGTYTWNFNNGATQTGSLSNVSSSYFPGTYTVSMSVSSFSCPVMTTTQTIIVPSYTCNLNANFSSSLAPNGQVNFANTSSPVVGNTTYTWNFGGSSTSNLMNPSHTYTANGTYTVMMQVQTGQCIDTLQTSVNVNNVSGPCNLNASFLISGSSPTYSFASNSSGTTSLTTYAWNFGDGNMGAGISTSHTYSASGNYTVTLYANNNTSVTCSDSSSLVVTVTGPCPVNAAFSSSVNGSTASFTSTSTGTVASSIYSWNYGDGNNGTGITSSHTYTAPGNYFVILSVQNGSVGCIDTIGQSVTIGTVTPCNLNASFTHTVGTGGTVNFSSSSTGTVTGSTYLWYFGDGFFSNSGPNVSHTYASAGAYSAFLYVYNNTPNTCNDSIGQSLNVTGIACIANSNFTVFPSGTPQYWSASPSYPWNVTNASWNWGDGSSSNTLYTSHTYSAQGTYSICLTVTVNCGNVSTTCMNQFINKSDANNLMVYINVVKPPTIMVAIRDNETSADFFSVYPNPNNGNFNLKMKGLDDGLASITITNAIGQEVYSNYAKAENMELNSTITMNGLSEGVYFLMISSQDKTYTKKIIVSK